MQPKESHRGEAYDRLAYARPCSSDDPAEALRSVRPYLARLVRLYFPRDREAKILELACGAGGLVWTATEAGYRHVRGVDISRAQIEIARQLGIKGVEYGDAIDELAAIEDASLDCLVSIDFLEHLSDDDLFAVTRDAHRALKPRGRWLVHVPNGASPFIGRVRWGDITHQRAFTRQSLEQLLIGAGFASVQVHEDAPTVHGFKSLVRFAGWKLLRALGTAWLACESGVLDEPLSQNVLAVAYRR